MNLKKGSKIKDVYREETGVLTGKGLDNENMEVEVEWDSNGWRSWKFRNELIDIDSKKNCNNES